MYLIALDFWSLVVYFFMAGVLLITFRAVLTLGRYTERLVANFAQMGMTQVARALLVFLIGYDERTYLKSRFVLWNQVSVRFTMLWTVALLTATLTVWLEVPGIVWIPALLALFIYRSVTLWTTPARPRITTRDPALKQLIQDVNEPTWTPPKSVGSIIRRWDYLDELFAESA